MVLKHTRLKRSWFFFRKKKDRKKNCFSQSYWGREEGTSRKTFRDSCIDLHPMNASGKKIGGFYWIDFLVLYAHLGNMQSEAFCNVALDSNCTHTHTLSEFTADERFTSCKTALFCTVVTRSVPVCVCVYVGTHMCVCVYVHRCACRAFVWMPFFHHLHFGLFFSVVTK